VFFFILFLRRLSADLNFPFAALSAEAGAASAASTTSSISFLVTLFIAHPNRIIANLIDLFKIFSPDTPRLGLSYSVQGLDAKC